MICSLKGKHVARKISVECLHHGDCVACFQVREKYLQVRHRRLDVILSTTVKHVATLELEDENGPFTRKLLNEAKDLVLSVSHTALKPPRNEALDDGSDESEL